MSASGGLSESLEQYRHVLEYAAMQQAVDRLREQGYLIAPEQLWHIWPTKYKHMQVDGHYQFNREEIAKLAQQWSLSV